MRTLSLVLILTIWISRAQATNPATKCFDADSNTPFLVTETVPLDGPSNPKMPSLERNSDGKPIKLTWMPCPEDTTASVKEIGRYQGRSIYYVVYQKKNVTADTASVDRFECVMLAYQAPGYGVMAIRPFLVAFHDEQTSWSTPIFTAEKSQPFALEMSKYYSGNGVYWEQYTFVFTIGEARIAEHRAGGRHVPTETQSYNKVGKVISTRTDSND